jgi:hypothetical protein
MDIFYLSIFTSVMLILFGVFFIFNGIQAISRQKIGFPLVGSFTNIGFANIGGKSAKYLGLFFIILGIVVIISAIQFYFFINSDTVVPSLGCTQEAKVCPDGSSVVRVEPSCEFVECPAYETASSSFSTSTDNWQTYRNEEYQFEFEYPPTWGEIATSSIYSGNSIADYYIPRGKPGPPQSFFVYKKNIGQLLSDWYEDNFLTGSQIIDSGPTITEADGHKILEVISSFEEVTRKHVFFEKAGIVVEFFFDKNYVNPNYPREYEDVFPPYMQKILDSFKFLD